MNYAKSYFTQIKELGSGMVSFVMSTPTVDRMSDVVEQNWDLSDFKSNPIALWNHDSSLPIGRWHNVKVAGGQLSGELEFMDESISPFAAKIGRMVKSGFLKACSVGFIPKEAVPMKNGGYRFTKNALTECSVVSIPANPQALQFAKSFCSDREISRLFAAQGSELKVRQARARHMKTLSNYL